jgi:hypothetical protein
VLASTARQAYAPGRQMPRVDASDRRPYGRARAAWNALGASALAAPFSGLLVYGASRLAGSPHGDALARAWPVAAVVPVVLVGTFLLLHDPRPLGDPARLRDEASYLDGKVVHGWIGLGLTAALAVAGFVLFGLDWPGFMVAMTVMLGVASAVSMVADRRMRDRRLAKLASQEQRTKAFDARRR